MIEITNDGSNYRNRQQIENKMKKEADVCPICKSTNTSALPFRDGEFKLIRFECICSSCGCEWNVKR